MRTCRCRQACTSSLACAGSCPVPPRPRICTFRTGSRRPVPSRNRKVPRPRLLRFLHCKASGRCQRALRASSISAGRSMMSAPFSSMKWTAGFSEDRLTKHSTSKSGEIASMARQPSRSSSLVRQENVISPSSGKQAVGAQCHPATSRATSRPQPSFQPTETAPVRRDGARRPVARESASRPKELALLSRERPHLSRDERSLGTLPRLLQQPPQAPFIGMKTPAEFARMAKVAA